MSPSKDNLESSMVDGEKDNDRRLGGLGKCHVTDDLAECLRSRAIPSLVNSTDIYHVLYSLLNSF